ncbi:hypothetical protein JCM10207_006881 [Rhodosporidiobolus poonsookiae]
MPRPVTLPRLLSLLPRNGVGARVYQSRWQGKGLPVPSAAQPDDGCYWEVKKVRLRVDDEGKVHGRAWGVHNWKGKRTTPADKEHEPIRGGLKYLWQSSVVPSLLVEQPSAPAPAPPAQEA